MIRQIKFSFKSTLTILILLASSISSAATTSNANLATTIVHIDFGANAKAKRLGINLGARAPQGAANYIKNLIPNPGFETAEYATIFSTLSGANGDRVQADKWQVSWRPDSFGVDFWNGAEYEFVTGARKGSAGFVYGFTNENDRYTFYMGGMASGQAPAAGDVFIVRKKLEPYQADIGDYNNPEPNDIRPGSTGEQSVRLLTRSQPFEPSFQLVLDNFGGTDASAGKLLHVQGSYQLSFWAKGLNSSSSLKVHFKRNGGAIFYNPPLINLTADWQQHTLNFWVDPSLEQPLTDWQGPVILEFIVNNGDLLLDDASLMQTGSVNPTVFTDPFVNNLRDLQPGIIRYWGAQLGSSLNNQLFDPFSRARTGFRMYGPVVNEHPYSLYEFLDLAREIGAEPWYVIPPTFSQSDLSNLIEYLAAPSGANPPAPYADWRASLGQPEPWTTVFDTIHLEYGNEIWGNGEAQTDPFAGATMGGGIVGAQVAHDRIGIMKNSPYYDPAKFNFVIGGQTRYTGRQTELEENSDNHDSIGFAPYYGELNAWGSADQRYYPLYALAKQAVTIGNMVENKAILDAHGSEMSIYEINLHAVDPNNNVSLDVRNDVLTGIAGGLSVPLTMLTYMRDMGVVNQVGFQALQYSFEMSNGEDARVWGMLRDSEATGNKRPTWLGMELANKAIRGSMINTLQTGDNPKWSQQPINGVTEAVEIPYIQSFAFRDGEKYGMIVFNLHLTDIQRVEFDLHMPAKPNGTLYTLQSPLPANPGADNESAEIVTITSQAINANQLPGIEMAPHSALVIEWESDWTDHIYLPITLTK